MRHSPLLFFFFFFNDTATTEIYTLSLHDALPISLLKKSRALSVPQPARSQRWSSLSHQRGCAFAEFHHHGVLRNHFRHVLLVFVLRQKFCAQRVEVGKAPRHDGTFYEIGRASCRE